MSELPPIPMARQRVLVKGRAGLYFVLTVNQEFGYADLVELESATLVEGVQFDKILPLLSPEIEPGSRSVWVSKIEQTNEQP